MRACGYRRGNAAEQQPIHSSHSRCADENGIRTPAFRLFNNLLLGVSSSDHHGGIESGGAESGCVRFMTPSKRSPKSLYASPIWSRVKVWVSSGVRSTRP